MKLSEKNSLPNYVKGQLVVKLINRADNVNGSKEENHKASFGEDVDALLKALNVIAISKISPDTYLIKLPIETDLDKARARLSENRNIERVDFNYLRFTR